MLNSPEKAAIDTILSNAQAVLITSHIRPDADAFGSCIGFKHYIDTYFPKVTSRIVFTGSLGDLGAQFAFLEGHKYLEEIEDISQIINNFDTVVFLDGSELARFSNDTPSIDLAKFKTICIDHHLGDAPNFDFYFRDTSYSSCSEIVCELLFSDTDLEAKLVAEALYMGIHGDTGGFVFVDALKAKVHSTARRLVENGKIVVQNLLQNLGSIQLDHFELIRILIKNTVNYTVPNSKMPSFTYSYFQKADVVGMSDEDVKPGRAFYVSTFLRMLKGHTWGMVLTPEHSKPSYLLSLRSLPGSINVQEIGKFFGGGGHIHAAGGNVTALSLGLSEQDFILLDTPAIADLVIGKVVELFKQDSISLTTDA